jgi:hypothetical protein
MKRRRMCGLPAGGIALAATLMFLAQAAGAAPAASIWRVAPTPNPHPHAVNDVTFTAVSATGATDTWAVGINQDKNTVRHPLVENWNGQSWTLIAAAEPSGRQSWFNGVDALSPTNVWAVGESTNLQASNQDETTLIEHWDGHTWTIVSSPNPSTGPNSADVLEAVTGVGPTDLWAVGWNLDPATNSILMLFEHFDGKTWRAAASPSKGFQFAVAAKAISPNDVWAVGNDQTGPKGLTLAAHWNGTRWKLVPTPSLFDGIAPQNFLTGVTANAGNDVWASGYEDNVNQRNFAKPYALHWNGSKWTLVLLPNAGGEGNRLFGTVALSATDVWTVGQTQRNNGSILTLTQQFNGTSWKTVPSPTPGSVGDLSDGSLDSVASGGGGVLFAVGAQEVKGQCCLRTLALETSQG